MDLVQFSQNEIWEGSQHFKFSTHFPANKKKHFGNTMLYKNREVIDFVNDFRSHSFRKGKDFRKS